MGKSKKSLQRKEQRKLSIIEVDASIAAMQEAIENNQQQLDDTSFLKHAFLMLSKRLDLLIQDIAYDQDATDESIEEARVMAEDARSDISSLTSDLERLEKNTNKNLESLEEEINEINSKLEEVEEKADDAKSEVENVEDSCSELEKEVNKLETKIDELTSEFYLIGNGNKTK
jgi:chromosome segregation ATPase